jgi:hypothetical protein
MTVDELWNALREVACVTVPYTKATTIVAVRKDHVKKALKLIERKKHEKT